MGSPTGDNVEKLAKTVRITDYHPTTVIRDCNFVNITPLQLGEEVVDLHFLDSALVLSTFWTSASNRGAPRRLS